MNSLNRPTAYPAPTLGRLCILAAVVMASLIYLRSRFEVVVVSGDSMQPNLRQGGILVVNRRAYETTDPERGDVVVADYQGEWIVKRIVGLPGEEVEVKDGVLYINGVPAKENASIQPGPLCISKGRLMADRFALLGDNRSTMEFVHAVEPRNRIAGKVILAIGLPHFA